MRGRQSTPCLASPFRVPCVFKGLAWERMLLAPATGTLRRGNMQPKQTRVAPREFVRVTLWCSWLVVATQGCAPESFSADDDAVVSESEIVGGTVETGSPA